MDSGYGMVVRVVGIALVVVGVVLCALIARRRFSGLPAQATVSLGFVSLSAVAFWKLAALASLVVVPAATMAVANYHTFEGTHHVEACASCHVMRPMVTDMRDRSSDTLAARHFKNGWIPRDQCFHCHTDYGMSGDIAAKMEGFRHLARYTSGTYHEPIVLRGHYDNRNCLKCHQGTLKFELVASHHTAGELLGASGMSCLNCHGQAHPTRAARTPGSADYQRLMEGYR
jgi:nitrate/TMAO reductase-like tetraheme cytochrome c subunit